MFVGVHTIPAARCRSPFRALGKCRTTERIVPSAIVISYQGGGDDQLMHTHSLLAQAFVEPVFKLARQNLERDGFLAPVLFVNSGASDPLIVPLPQLPSSQERQRAFTALGVRLRRQGQTIHEAVLLMESWTVNAQKAPAALRFPPSQHPSRQEAIVLVGRNADNTWVTYVMQVFTRQQNKRLVWGEVPLVVYNAPAETVGRPSGLLDDLFLANQTR